LISSSRVQFDHHDSFSSTSYFGRPLSTVDPPSTLIARRPYWRSYRELNVVTFFSVVGLVMTILFAVYLGRPDDPATLLIQTSNASQINVAQNRLGLAGGYAEQTKVASVKTPLQPVPDADGVALADYQPLMATGLDLNGPPRRFSAKEIMRNTEIPGF
jgi:hypothetical protein